ncbi:MAG TPA: hypothetical protein VEV82_11105 [Actinomycetota bacterium]|nr:hypothetical protein [Actinomycetota bacterium]
MTDLRVGGPRPSTSSRSAGPAFFSRRPDAFSGSAGHQAVHGSRSEAGDVKLAGLDFA